MCVTRRGRKRYFYNLNRINTIEEEIKKSDTKYEARIFLPSWYTVRHFSEGDIR